MNHRTTVFALAALLLAASAWAHHNMSALFDFKDRVTLTGTLTKMDWRNPHISVYVDAKIGDDEARAAAAKACQQCTPDLCPKPVAAAPVPPKAAPTLPPKPAEPPARAAPEKLLPQKINFSGDALFDFDKAVLKPEGKAMLDDLVRTLQGAKYEVIIATGHADRFGSVAYNQKLSERRANAVRDYLAAKEIPLNRISPTGKGKSQPVTKPDACKGPKSPKVIACLQPDRRVDVEVTGTK